MLAQLPNLISLGRLGCAPAVVWAVLTARFELAFWLFLVAGVSDAVDGLLAKRLGATSVLGAWLDPLADKTLLVGASIALASGGGLPLWLVVMVVFRDLLIVGGAIVVQTMTFRLVVEPLIVSKVNTAAQIGLLAAALAGPAFGWSFPQNFELGVVTVAATTLLSGVAYVVTWVRRVNAWERDTARGEAGGDRAGP